MVVVAASFASAIYYFESSGRAVTVETRDMLSNGVPSADLLTQVRASLRKLDGELDRALLLLMEKRPANLAAIAEARRQIDEGIRRYRQLPYYPDELALNQRLDLELVDVDRELALLGREFERGDLQAAHERENGPWRHESDDVDETLRALINTNIRAVTNHALQIDGIRRRAAVFGLAAGGGALALALFATLMAGRAWRNQVRAQEERAAELEMFSARVAHDLMSPLASVSLSLGMAEREARDERVVKAAGRALSSLKRVRGIVEALLDFARSGGRPQVGARTPVCDVLNGVVDEMRPMAQAKGIELACALDGAGDAAASPGVLTVLVTNLVNNAIKYMGDAAEKRIELRAIVGPCVRVEVADTGPGLPPGFEARAFEAWQRGTTMVAGLGLGLATVKRLVDAHGGTVGVTRLPRGTLFWFELPRAA
jgi:signal transduction histidine kinase